MAIEWEFQKALYGALTGDAALMAVVASVNDMPAQEASGGASAAYPYVNIGLTFITEDDTNTELGHNVLSRIHTWSRTGSVKECKTIQGLIYDALHRQEFAVTGFNHYSLMRVSTDITIEADGVLHGICEYRALLETN